MVASSLGYCKVADKMVMAAQTCKTRVVTLMAACRDVGHSTYNEDQLIEYGVL